LYKHSKLYDDYQLTITSPSLENPKDIANAKKILEMFDKLANDLNKIFGLSILTRKRSLILKRYQLALRYCNERSKLFHAEYGALFLLAQNLNDIKSHDENIFNKLRKDVLTKSHERSWDGIRFEIAIARHLLCFCSIELIKRESPDFSFIYKGCTFYLESTITRVVQPKIDVLYKIGSTINKKNKKKYANSKTILAVDITNIYMNFFSDTSNEESNLESHVNKYLESNKVKYGAIIFYVALYDSNLGHYRLTYNYHIIDDCDASLKEFIEFGFPMRTHEGYYEPIFPGAM